MEGRRQLRRTAAGGAAAEELRATAAANVGRAKQAQTESSRRHLETRPRPTLHPLLGPDRNFAKFVPQFLLLWSSRNFAKFELARHLRAYFVARAHDLPLETSISAWNRQNGTDTFKVVCVRGGVVAFTLPGPAFYGGSGGDSIEIVPFEAILRISGDSGAR